MPLASIQPRFVQPVLHSPKAPVVRRRPPLGKIWIIAFMTTVILAAASPGFVHADDEPALPRFASIQSSEVNMRTGPGRQYPVDYVYRRQELPVQIIAEFDIWRRIRDIDGDIGWVHQAMLSGRRTVMVLGPDIAMMRGEPTLEAGVVARLEPGVIAEFDHCATPNAEKWCRIEADGYDGWIPAGSIWGISADD